MINDVRLLPMKQRKRMMRARTSVLFFSYLKNFSLNRRLKLIIVDRVRRCRFLMPFESIRVELLRKTKPFASFNLTFDDTYRIAPPHRR